MCGRFLIDESALNAAQEIAPVPEYIQIELNLKTIYPSTQTCIFSMDDHHIQASLAAFGFENPYKKGLIINARAETVTQKPMFSKAFRQHRCIIPCTLFYEWTPEKRQVSFFSKEAAVLYLAGILFKSGEDASFVILTTQANKSVSDVHHRMPVVLNKNEAIGYLENTAEAVQDLKKPMPMLEKSWFQPSLFQ